MSSMAARRFKAVQINNFLDSAAFFLPRAPPHLRNHKNNLPLFYFSFLLSLPPHSRCRALRSELYLFD